MSLDYVAVAAAARTSRIIGWEGKIPWKLREEQRWFRRLTQGGILLMGRKTWYSLPRTLLNRPVVVLSRQPMVDVPVPVVSSRAELEASLRGVTRPVYVCGGAQVYQEFLPLCRTAFISWVEYDGPGDTFLPEFESGFAESEELWRVMPFKVCRYYCRRENHQADRPADPAPDPAGDQDLEPAGAAGGLHLSYPPIEDVPEHAECGVGG